MSVSMFKRERLAEKGQMACPGILAYPLDTKARVKNAMARYAQSQTRKCKGGIGRICKAYRKFGLTDTDAYVRRCR